MYTEGEIFLPGAPDTLQSGRIGDEDGPSLPPDQAGLFQVLKGPIHRGAADAQLAGQTGGGALHCAIGEAAEQIADHPALRIPHSQGTQPGVEEADAAGEIGQIVPAQQGLLPQKAVQQLLVQ